jgi:hypothetical protein
MQIVETKVYTFDELSGKAKEKARQWYRSGDDFSFYAECVIEDAKTIGALMGIDIERVYYSGFYSQGDGACFEGRYEYKKGAVKAVKEYAPQDDTLHNIASELQAIQRRNFYRLTARVKHSGHYYHGKCTSIAIENNGEYFFDTDNSYVRESTHDGAALVIALRKLMEWIYEQLSNENDYHNEDAQVDEIILANEYTFTEDGGRF